MKYLISGLVFIVVLIYAYPVLFGPSNVVKEVDIFTEDENVVLQIDFDVPIRYEDHFPEKMGEILQVKFRLVSLSNVTRKEVISPETLRPELVDLISLVNITFEGGVPGGPLLTLLFSKPVTYEVREDVQLKSLFVVFSKVKLMNGKS